MGVVSAGFRQRILAGAWNSTLLLCLFISDLRLICGFNACRHKHSLYSGCPQSGLSEDRTSCEKNEKEVRRSTGKTNNCSETHHSGIFYFTTINNTNENNSKKKQRKKKSSHCRQSLPHSAADVISQVDVNYEHWILWITLNQDHTVPYVFASRTAANNRLTINQIDQSRIFYNWRCYSAGMY